MRLITQYGVCVSTDDVTLTPTTATVSSTTSAVTFRITNNDPSPVSVIWQIRQSSTGGTLRNSGTLSLGTGANNTVNATGLNQGTTFWLTNVFATASGKDVSVKAVDRSISTSCTANGTYAGSFCSGGALYYEYHNGSCGYYSSLQSSCSSSCGCCPSNGTYAGSFCSGGALYYEYHNGSCGYYSSLQSSCSSSCGCNPCSGCSSYGTYLGQSCSGCALYNVYADGCCGSYESLASSNSTTCCPPPPGPTCAERQGEVISSACISGTTRRITTYDGGGTYPNCTTSFQDISDPSCSSGGCLDENTIVPLFDGSYKVIKDLEVGDELVGYYVEGMIDEDIPGWEEWKTDSPNEGMIIPVTLNSVKKDTYHSYYLINNSIKITIKHPFFASRDGLTWGWIDTPDLKVGDKVFTIDKEVISISSIEFIEDTINVVTLNVEEVDCYFATENNILVHNDIVKA
jgi:hypothetical protein